ncbi:MAG: MotA/TolQ/ExbB proton channel family protein [Lentisphaerae bacterium]|nr:MotA/TolQ/ExbB proton channel family protein [Lentisphaerota bacterium]
MKKLVMSAVMLATLLGAPALLAQEAAAPGAAAGAAVEAAAPGLDSTLIVDAESGAPVSAQRKRSATSFYDVMTGSGPIGFLLWMALFGSGAAAIYFIVDCSILVRPAKMLPGTLIDQVKSAMAEGDVLKALKACESEPSSMANILSAGFSHVEEGYDIIQESVGTAADLETERLMQRLTWISVCANLAPMLGLLGTVQGMIMAFGNIATAAPDVGALALAIAQALWTTAGGLVVAIPAITFYYGIRNNANKLVLRMEAMTMELIKDLRNVEVVND